MHNIYRTQILQRFAYKDKKQNNTEENRDIAIGRKLACESFGRTLAFGSLFVQLPHQRNHRETLDCVVDAVVQPLEVYHRSRIPFYYRVNAAVLLLGADCLARAILDNSAKESMKRFGRREEKRVYTRSPLRDARVRSLFRLLSRRSGKREVANRERIEKRRLSLPSGRQLLP